jgi:hypothetical protein
MRPTLFGEAAMADVVPTPVVDPTTGVNPNPADAEGDKPLGENGEKALRAERSRATAAEKLVADLQAQVKQFQDAGKSAEDKQAEQAATLANERDAATVKALRYEVCAQPEISLPLAAAQFLTGNTQAEIEASAKALKALGAFGGATPPNTPGLPPSPNAGNEPPKVGKADAGLAKARERFGDLIKK